MEANEKLRKEKKNTGVTACPMETSKTTSSFLFIGRVLSAVVFSIVSFGADDVCDEGKKKKWDKKKEKMKKTKTEKKAARISVRFNAIIINNSPLNGDRRLFC